MGLLTAGRWEEEEEVEEKQKQEEERGGEKAETGKGRKYHVAAAQKLHFYTSGSQTVQLTKLRLTWTRVLFFRLRRETKKQNKKTKQLLSQFVQQSRYQELRNRTKSAINVKEIS